jgi:uncharacterized membrane protein YagU involved in acid resistance
VGFSLVQKGEKIMSAITTETHVDGIKTGILAGLVGGLAFGIMMAVMGMLPMVAMLVGSDNAVVGFLVHMLISAFIGAVYGLVAIRLPEGWGITIAAGAVNGVVWWVLGALLLMPLMLGMAEMVFAVGEMQWWSLVGHLIYGVITAVAFVQLKQRL